MLNLTREPINVFAVINGDNVDDEPAVLNPVNDAVIAASVFIVTLPWSFKKTAQGRIGRQPIDRGGDLFACFAVALDKPIEFLLGEL